MNWSQNRKSINFSEKLRFFLPIFWNYRNERLNDGFCRESAEWYAIGHAIHETLVKYQMHPRDNTAFIFHIKNYLRENNLVSPDLAIPHLQYETIIKS